MHMMGKIGVWLVVVAAAASTFLTSKLIQVRDGWTKKSTAYQAELQKLRPKIASLTDELALLETQRMQAKELWGDYWKDVPTGVLPGGTGTVVINVGVTVPASSSRDIFFREKQGGPESGGMTLYGFEILPDGKSVYRGDFTVVTAREAQSQLQPKWAVRPDDVQTWQPESKWRWRLLIPPTYQSNYDTQIRAIVKADDVLSDRKKILANEIQLEVQAQDHLKLREAELLGGPQLSKDETVEVEFREGLVVAVEQVEEARNHVLIKIDELRHKLREVQHRVDRLKQDNVELATKLPQPESDPPESNPKLSSNR